LPDPDELVQEIGDTEDETNGEEDLGHMISQGTRHGTQIIQSQIDAGIGTVILEAGRMGRLTMKGRFSYLAAKRPITSTKMDIGNMTQVTTYSASVF
jgi:hypothetical protein